MLYDANGRHETDKERRRREKEEDRRRRREAEEKRQMESSKVIDWHQVYSHCETIKSYDTRESKVSGKAIR